MLSGPVLSAPVLSGPVQLLVDGVAAVRAQCPTALPEVQALTEAAVVLTELEKLTAVSLRRVADVHTRQLHVHAAAPSTSAWVAAQQVGLSPAFLALAKKLARVPAVADAVAQGRLAVPSAAKVAAALDTVRPHLDRADGLIDGHDGEATLANVLVEGVVFLVAEARGGYPDTDPALPELAQALVGVLNTPQSQASRLERGLLLLAEHLEPALLGAALDRLADAVLPLQLLDRADRGHDQRGLRLTRKPDGSGWTLSRSDLDLECGELLFTVLTAARATDPDNPADTAAWATTRQHAGDGGGGGGEPTADEPTAPAPRSRVQQDHDALTRALRALLDTQALGRRAKTCPHLLITVSAATLHDQSGALPATGASGANLPAGLVRRLLCDSRLTRLVLSPGHRVLEVSHTHRTLKAHERHALHVQWGGRCAGAGCTSPPGTPLIPHHADPWHRTGTTSIHNTIPVCQTTHHDIHEGHKVIRLRDGRYLGPDGWTNGPGGTCTASDG